MIISALIVSKTGDIFCSNLLPYELKIDISKHANNFLYAIKIEDDDIELPYIETSKLRYIYKQTDDLYWVLVTKPESEMFTDIHLLGKFVCAIMEYGSTETNSSTITEEQKELFYRHIWRPWDEGAQCPFCNCHCSSSGNWEREFDNRLQFLINIRDGNVEENDVIYFNGLIAEAWSISAKLSPRWNTLKLQDQFNDSDSDSFCSSDFGNHSVSEESVIDGCRLKCLLEDIRIELTRIQDPYLRLFAKRNLPIGSHYHANQMSSAPSLKEIDSDDQCDEDCFNQTTAMQ